MTRSAWVSLRCSSVRSADSFPASHASLVSSAYRKCLESLTSPADRARWGNQDVVTGLSLTHSEMSTSDVLSCGSGFKVHTVQVRHFHFTVLSSQDFHSCIFGCCVERAGTLVSIHDQNSLCCQNQEFQLKGVRHKMKKSQTWLGPTICSHLEVQVA